MENESNTNFGIASKDLEDMIDKYKRRKYDEEIIALEELGGMEGIINGVKANVEQGLSENEKDMQNRIEAYGSNYREP